MNQRLNQIGHRASLAARPQDEAPSTTLRTGPSKHGVGIFNRLLV
jgi:hypothetical protein